MYIVILITFVFSYLFTIILGFPKDDENLSLITFFAKKGKIDGRRIKESLFVFFYNVIICKYWNIFFFIRNI
jgi:hypothetical protein